MSARASTLAALSLAALVGCSVDLPDAPGLACDELHPCRTGRACVDGACLDVAPLDAGAGGGAAGGSGGGADPVDAGSVRWRQRADGFSGQSVASGCSLTIDPAQGNQVTSTIKNANDSSDRATANQTDAGALPQTGDGRLQGHFTLPSALALSGTSPFVSLTAGGRPLLTFAFNGSGELVCSTAAGLLDAQAITQTVAWAGGFAKDVDYTLEATWVRGQYRRVLLNGQQVLEASLNPLSGAVEPPDQLKLGIARYDGDAGTGWTVTLHDWQLADGPQVAF